MKTLKDLSEFKTQEEFDNFSTVIAVAAKKTIMLTDPHTGHKTLTKLANVKDVAISTGISEKQIRIWIKKDLLDECFGLVPTILGRIHSSYFNNINPYV